MQVYVREFSAKNMQSGHQPGRGKGGRNPDVELVRSIMPKLFEQTAQMIEDRFHT